MCTHNNPTRATKHCVIAIIMVTFLRKLSKSCFCRNKKQDSLKNKNKILCKVWDTKRGSAFPFIFEGVHSLCKKLIRNYIKVSVNNENEAVQCILFLVIITTMFDSFIRMTLVQVTRLNNFLVCQPCNARLADFLFLKALLFFAIIIILSAAFWFRQKWKDTRRKIKKTNNVAFFYFCNMHTWKLVRTAVSIFCSIEKEESLCAHHRCSQPNKKILRNTSNNFSRINKRAETKLHTYTQS